MADAEFKNQMKKDLIWTEIGKMVNKTGMWLNDTTMSLI
jgi:hypothetical protein